MDEKLDNLLRTIVAEQDAIRFLLEYALRRLLLELDPDTRKAVGEELLKASGNMAPLEGVAKGDDYLAERLSDIFVRRQTQIEAMLERIIQACAEADANRAS